MIEPSSPIDPAATVREVDPRYGGGELESGLDRLHRTKRRRKLARGGVALAAAVALGTFAWTSWPSPEAPPVAAPSVPAATEPGVMALQDGSEVHLTDDSNVRIDESGLDRQRLTLVEGGARFEVVPNPERTFRVEVGDVAVEVLGTAFTLTRRLDERVRVEVERGRVRVEWPDGTRTLGGGEHGLFPPRRDQPVVPPSTETEAAPPRPSAGRADWREPARRGEYAEARVLLERAGPGVARDEVEELMLAADVQRYSGHPAAALPYLERVTRRHADDPRAGLAAFTSGRILYERLGRPREAAEAFALSRRLEPTGSLAEDALAREADAWGRAGVLMEARRCAEEYQRRFPTGRRAETMEQWLAPAR